MGPHDRAPAPGMPFELHRREGRDALLVVAVEPLRAALLELGRSKDLDVHLCATPLAACDTLERVGARIAYAIISSDPPWGIELRRLLAEEHPQIEVIKLVV